MDDQGEFCDVVIEGRRRELNVTLFEEEVLAVVSDMAKDNPDMTAPVIEYADLPPFAQRIQEIIHVPVIDMATLTNMVYESLVRAP